MIPNRFAGLVVVPFLKKLTWVLLVASLVAFGFGIRKARAQAYEMQSFTAVETTVVRGVEYPVPFVDNGVIGVSDGGNLIARLGRSAFGNDASIHTRWVVNVREKTNTLIDDGSKMKVPFPYKDFFAAAVSKNRAGERCDGSPADKIEGLDTYLKETTGTSGKNTSERKIWLAPKLGCFVIREEQRTIDKDGKLVRFLVHSLTNIEVGEPDPAYFDTSLADGYTDTKLEDYKGTLVNHQKATAE